MSDVMGLGSKEHYEVWIFYKNPAYRPRTLCDFDSLEEAESWVNEERDRYQGDMEIVRETSLRQLMTKESRNE